MTLCKRPYVRNLLPKPATRLTKPATQQPASQKGQPAASESRESIRFTTSYIDLPVKLFHILRKWQPLSLQYATTLHQILHHLTSAETLHLLLNASKEGIQPSFEQIVDLLKKLNYNFDISESIVRLFRRLSTPFWGILTCSTSSLKS